jgi:predicted NAD/FAD-binding protein
MLWDVMRFKKDSEDLLESDDYRMTLAAFLTGKGYSRAFVQHFIIPMGEAVWSTDPVKFNEFPALYFAQFFKNHGFLNIKDQPRWLTVKGRSRQYIKPITRPYADQIRLNCPVASVRRRADFVEIHPQNQPAEKFDQVVIATHSDQAMAMLEDPTYAEQNILGAIPYQENEAVLHCDESLLPSKKAAWASWNYHIPQEDKGRVAVTYDMNILQSIGAPEEFCVSLNLAGIINPVKIHRKFIYHHPVYNPESLTARQSHAQINGAQRTYYAGAYWGYGFHEDGVRSALEVTRHFGKTL